MLDASAPKAEKSAAIKESFKAILTAYVKSADDAIDMAAMDPINTGTGLQTADDNYRKLVGQLTTLWA